METLTTPQLRILEGLADLAFATNRQLTRFAYSRGCYTAIAGASLALFTGGYIDRTKRMINPPEKVYFLKEKGRRFLAAYGLDTLPKVPRSIPRHWLYQEHALAINDVALIARELPDATLDTFQTDRELRRRPIPVSGRNYIPDAWFALTAPRFDPAERFFLLEVDRGTEEEGKWRAKVATIVAFAGRPVAERFGTRRFTAVVAALPVEGKDGEKRRDRLMLWTKRELTRLRKEEWGRIFLFGANDAGAMAAAAYFTGRHWLALDGTNHALLEQ